MEVNYIALAIPVFFLLIGIELFAAWRKRKKWYRLNDALTNISLGTGQQLTGIFTKTILFVAYLYLYEHFAVWNIENTLLNWFLLFLGVDFCYYWFHRYSHEINALWAAHVVHHQSEEYNLTVALRQSWFQSWFSWAFYLPLAVIGFDPIMFLTVSAFNTLYQFWIHTKGIKNLGPLEWVINTPSHHRVHHGSNPKYIDKNHAGSLIIWDRMFGTFQKEEEEPTYGITTQLKSWNPLWANLQHWSYLFDISARSKGWDKVRVFYKPPGWQPDYLGGYQAPPEIDENTYKKYDTATPIPFQVYTFLQFVVLLGISSYVLFFEASFDLFGKTILIASLIWGMVNVGAIFDGKKWSFMSEYIRVLSLFAIPLIVPFQGLITESIYFFVGYGALSLIAFAWIHQIYKKNSHDKSEIFSDIKTKEIDKKEVII